MVDTASARSFNRFSSLTDEGPRLIDGQKFVPSNQVEEGITRRCCGDEVGDSLELARVYYADKRLIFDQCGTAGSIECWSSASFAKTMNLYIALRNAVGCRPYHNPGNFRG